MSAASLEHTRALAARHDVSNLTLHRLPDRASRRARRAIRSRRVHRVSCTTSPIRCAGLRATARRARRRTGRMTLMVYARYGRAGVYLLQDYCRRLGVGTSAAELRRPRRDAARAPARRTRSAGCSASRATSPTTTRSPTPCATRATCLHRSRAARARRAMPACGSAAGSARRPTCPTAARSARRRTRARIAALPAAEQYALVELFRGTMTRHTAIALRRRRHDVGTLDFATPAAAAWVPVRVADGDRRRGAPAARRRCGVDQPGPHRQRPRAVRRPAAERRSSARSTGDARSASSVRTPPPFVERLWRHDLVVVDTTDPPTSRISDERSRTDDRPPAIVATRPDP